MTLDEFKNSVRDDAQPNSELSDPLKALWHEAKGDWERAHELSQSAGNAEGDLVHAYLHRVEGDICNASYWYNRAGRPRFEGSFESERNSIVAILLDS